MSPPVAQQILTSMKIIMGDDGTTLGEWHLCVFVGTLCNEAAKHSLTGSILQKVRRDRCADSVIGLGSSRSRLPWLCLVWFAVIVLGAFHVTFHRRPQGGSISQWLTLLLRADDWLTDFLLHFKTRELCHLLHLGSFLQTWHVYNGKISFPAKWKRLLSMANWQLFTSK